MPPWEAVLSFTITSIIIVAIPGPSVLFVVGRTLAYGRRAGVWTVLGNELGSLPLVAAVAVGIGAIISESIYAFIAVKFIGAAYLAYLGIQAIRHRGEGLEAPDTPGKPTELGSWICVRQGFVVGVSNPKTIVFFVAVLPQFVDHSRGYVPIQMLALGLVFTTVAFACDGMWALLSGTARTWFVSSPRRLSRTRVAGGTMMVGLAGVLTVAGNKV
ncbi:lysine transporter LysE [Rhodococcus sp. CUA-806]|jgi:threonine/homoserine/homoserine lactone efflux protein|nr:lysine transporter LysE [Rhodococcus sp. CUA-806]OLT34959.1 lysine transporter LysE [Rhodococcus sp. CUA-806]